jgi:hypothetical protein
MKKSYKVILIILGVLLVTVLSIGTGYGVWLSTRDTSSQTTSVINCFKIYQTDSNIVELKNITPVVNEEGVETSPYTLTITNICKEDKELQLRLNTLKDTTVDTRALTVKVSGNIEKDITLYKNLDGAKTTNPNVEASKILGTIVIKPNETIRTNVKIWFDEKKTPSIDKQQFYRGTFEIIDTDSAIKATLAETILGDPATVDLKPLPSFAEASYTEEGLYRYQTADGSKYYYRGVVNNNYIKFADHTWRIVGINPDKSVRIILDKSAVFTNYSNSVNSIDYTGYQYIYNNVAVDNTVTTALNTWYSDNILNRGFDKYVVMQNYCNDSTNKVVSYHTYFGAYNRLVTAKEPTADCPATTLDFGGTYTSKVGLLSADEVSIAGGVHNTNNYNYYLYNGESFYTSSGAEYYNYTAHMMVVNNSGALTISANNSGLGVRPVINLDNSTTVTGSGTIDNPYIVDL